MPSTILTQLCAHPLQGYISEWKCRLRLRKYPERRTLQEAIGTAVEGLVPGDKNRGTTSQALGPKDTGPQPVFHAFGDYEFYIITLLVQHPEHHALG